MEGKPLTDELWREYEFSNDRDTRIVYRINRPKVLYVGTTTHRVVDESNIVHCVPAVGERGCVLRWAPRDPSNPVQY